MYAAFEVHTEETIAAGEEALLAFSSLLEVRVVHVLPITNTTIELRLQRYSEATKDLPEPKNWNFPKAHTHKHLFDDVQAKGVTRNYSTKPNEKLHGPLKRSYALRTNFKDVANQVRQHEAIFL